MKRNDISSYTYIEGSIPVLLELPHGGHFTPDEVKPYLHPKFTPGDRREDSDEFSDELYMGHKANAHVLRSNMWRAHADPNRHKNDLARDGAVKTHTSQGVKIYQSSRGLPENIRADVIKNYILPYQQKLQELLADKRIKNIIFCHTMPGIGTGTSGDRGNLRPLFMFGNGGDKKGNPLLNSGYASQKLMLHLSDIIEENVKYLDVEFNFCDVIRYNDPYTGINSLSRFPVNKKATREAFTIEINRDLLLHNPENIKPTRDIVNQIILAVEAWSKNN